MTTTAHLWAIGYDDVSQANKVRDRITNLAWDNGGITRALFLYDVAVVFRNSDGTFTIDRQPFPVGANVLTLTTVGFLAGLVLATPLAGAAVGALVGSAVSAAMASRAGISNDF